MRFYLFLIHKTPTIHQSIKQFAPKGADYRLFVTKQFD